MVDIERWIVHQMTYDYEAFYFFGCYFYAQSAAFTLQLPDAKK